MAGIFEMPAIWGQSPARASHLKSIADQNGEQFEIITEGQIPQVFKDYFISKGILFKESFI